MVWGTYAVKIEVQMAFAQIGPDRYLGNARIEAAFFSGTSLNASVSKTGKEAIYIRVCQMFQGSFLNFPSRGESAIFSYPWILIVRDFLHMVNKDRVHNIKDIEEDDEIRHLGIFPCRPTPQEPHTFIHPKEMCEILCKSRRRCPKTIRFWL